MGAIASALSGGINIGFSLDGLGSTMNEKATSSAKKFEEKTNVKKTIDLQKNNLENDPIYNWGYKLGKKMHDRKRTK